MHMTVLTNRSQSLIQVERKDRINPCGKNREMKYTVVWSHIVGNILFYKSIKGRREMSASILS